MSQEEEEDCTPTPEAKDLRPISLTNMSYKIFMRIIRERIDTHLKMNEEGKEEQS